MPDDVRPAGMFARISLATWLALFCACCFCAMPTTPPTMNDATATTPSATTGIRFGPDECCSGGGGGGGGGGLLLSSSGGGFVGGGGGVGSVGGFPVVVVVTGGPSAPILPYFASAFSPPRTDTLCVSV